MYTYWKDLKDWRERLESNFMTEHRIVYIADESRKGITRGCIGKLFSKRKTYMTKELQKKAAFHGIYLTMKGEKIPNGGPRRETKDTFWITTERVTKRTTSEVRYKTVRGNSIENFYNVAGAPCPNNAISIIIAAVMRQEGRLRSMNTSSREQYINRVLTIIEEGNMEIQNTQVDDETITQRQSSDAVPDSILNGNISENGSDTSSTTLQDEINRVLRESNSGSEEDSDTSSRLIGDKDAQAGMMCQDDTSIDDNLDDGENFEESQRE